MEETGAGDHTKDVKGKIVEFLWWMKKEGYRPSTIESRVKMIRTLFDRGADLFYPEKVKEVIAEQETWNDSTKAKVVDDYSCFITMLGLVWKAPKYRRCERLPFIPLESELDQLIAGCGRRVAAFLQGLKETGADPGELWRVEWTDVDVEKRVLTLNHPVKGHSPRSLPISASWISMVERLPRNGKRIFTSTQDSLSANFRCQRRRLECKLGNPRLGKVCFTTFRHWKGTMEYHRTGDAYHVKKILGHKSLKNTEIYIHLEEAVFQASNEEFHVKVAESVDEARALLESGFEYVGRIHEAEMFRKRK